VCSKFLDKSCYLKIREKASFDALHDVEILDILINIF
jgi:hypothetical protein